MNAITEELQGFLEREKIKDCIARLARGEDRRNPELIKSAYWPDSVTDYGVFKGDFDAYFAWVYPGADAIKNTQHVLGQSYIEMKGERALAETHVVSYHRVDYGTGNDGADEHDTCIGGRYLDTMEKRGIEWRIASRTMLYDWYQDWGSSIDWAQGVMGLPLSHPHFSGRAVGDYSEVFFGQRPA